MRSRRPEGSGGVRIRSPPPTKVRDHHRPDWRPNIYRKERFSPPPERERLSRRALGSGDRRSASIERRDFSRHFDGGRDDGGVRIRSRPLDESFPHRESPHAEYRRKYFDVDIEGNNNNSKHVGVNGIGGGSGGGTSRATKDKDFQGNGSSGLDGLVQKSMCLEGGIMRTFFTLPPDAGYSSSGFNLSKIGGSSTFPSTSSLGGNLNIDLREDEDIRYHDRLTSNKMPAREPYEEEKQQTFYSRDVSYPMPPATTALQSKAFGCTSSGLARDDFFSSYRDGLNLQSVGGYGRSIGGKFTDPLDRNGYGVGQKLFDHTNGPELESKDMKSYGRGLLSPARDEPHGYNFLELDRRDRGGSGFLSDELYRKMHPSARGEYSLMDPLGSTFIARSGDRIDDTDSSHRTLRESGGSLWDHQTLRGDPVTGYHDVNRGPPLAMDRRGEPFGSGNKHLSFGTKVTRDHDIMHSGGDYGFGRDAGPVGCRERFQSPPLSDRDPDIYRLDMDTQRRSNVEDFGIYAPSERTAKRTYVIDEVNRHNPRSALPNTRSTSRHIQDRSGSDEHDRWIGEQRVGQFPSKRLGFGRAPHKMSGRLFGSSRKVTISNAWLPSEDVPLHEREVGGRDLTLKRRLRHGPSEFHNSFQFDKRQDFYRPRKFQKGSMDDRYGANAHDEDALEEVAPLLKTDPPEGSEEFKQQVHRAFLRFAKQLNENPSQQRRYREQGKAGNLLCSVCGSLSKEFVDTHSLVTHAFNSLKVGLRTDHLGLHKALCVLMGWNSLTAPDNARAYQSIPAAEASALKEDLILWPPLIIIHNSSIGNKNTNEQVVVTNERMEEILRGMGFGAGKTKVCRGKPANHSILVVKFLPTFSGLQEAERLHNYYAEYKRGRKELQQIASNDSKGGGELRSEKAEELLLYGYMGIAGDLDKLDFEMKKRCVVKSMKEIEAIADASLKTD